MKIFKSFTKQLTACLLILFAINAHAVRTTTYYHTDGLGSVVAASDESGNLLWRKSYAPYGEQIDGNTDNEPVSYTGKKHDDVTGLTYFGARYYDPRIGRFMATDPVHFMESNPVSFNRYAYVNNNPYKYVDPDGKILFLAPIAIFILKEVAAEGLSIYTGGATDFLSTRRVAMKAGKFAKNKLAEAVQTANRDSAIKNALEKANTKPDFIVTSNGTVVRNSAQGARADLEAGGFPGRATTETAENGTIHTGIPTKEGNIDIRIMDGQQTGGNLKGPRISFTRSGTNDRVRSDGSRFRNNEDKTQRLKESHIHLP
jgi:RHS repeat-associated protein